MTDQRGIPRQATRELEALRQALVQLERARKAVRFCDGDGREHLDIEIPAADSKDIRHGLKRSLRGWVSYSLRATGTCVLRESDRNEDTLTIHNDGGSSVTFDLWVF